MVARTLGLHTSLSPSGSVSPSILNPSQRLYGDGESHAVRSGKVLGTGTSVSTLLGGIRWKCSGKPQVSITSGVNKKQENWRQAWSGRLRCWAFILSVVRVMGSFEQGQGEW